MNTRNIQTKANSNKNTSKPERTQAEKDEAVKKSTEYYNSGNAKPGSLMSRANMVKQYNEKNNKENK